MCHSEAFPTCTPGVSCHLSSVHPSHPPVPHCVHPPAPESTFSLVIIFRGEAMRKGAGEERGTRKTERHRGRKEKGSSLKLEINCVRGLALAKAPLISEVGDEGSFHHSHLLCSLHSRSDGGIFNEERMRRGCSGQGNQRRQREAPSSCIH